MNVSLSELLQIIGPAVAVYAAIRADIAAMKVRLDHLERDRRNIHHPQPSGD